MKIKHSNQRKLCLKFRNKPLGDWTNGQTVLVYMYSISFM